jgi:hypothetical protein
MAGVKADTQALSQWLLTDSTTLANTPFVFGVLQAALLRGLAKGKHLQPGGPDVNCLDCSSSEDCSSWVDPNESEDPEVALRRFLNGIVGSEKVDSSLRGILDPIKGKGILIVTTKQGHTKVVLLERSRLPGNDKIWTVSSLDSLAGAQIWDDDLKEGMTLLLQKTGLKTENSKFS